MNQKTVKKINYVYLLLTILLPIALIACWASWATSSSPTAGRGP